MRRRRGLPLVAILVVAVGALLATFAADNSPELGLDLQGGASVVLSPPEGTAGDTLDQAIEVIRNRVDGLGVAEPDITRQGSAVVVELPGVKDQRRAIEVVGDTAELRFRPVLDVVDTSADPTTTTTTSSTTTTSIATLAPPESTTTTTMAPTTATSIPETTSREENLAESEVILDDNDEETNLRYRLGPAALVGKSVDSAKADLEPNTGQWSVLVDLKDADMVTFNQLAAACTQFQPTCPTNQLAIEIDGVVVSAPQFEQADFGNDPINITGDFSEGEARDLAQTLRYGALPVQLEQQTVRTVSATLGKDSLRAGVIAGAIGTGLVLLYIVLYYRALGLVVVAGLAVWGSLHWSIISYLGSSQGLALSLAGVTGIVVSVGITVDSYVVYFERLKDELRAGRTLRSSIDSGFKRAFRTILIADTSAFLGAAVLYWLTVGPVRGFAFFLGLSTVLDVVVAWFFTRPLVAMLGNRFASSGFIGVKQMPGAAPRPGLRAST